MLDLFLLPQTWISLLTLTALEIVLGIDNLIFIAIVTTKLPTAQQHTARQFGLLLACVTRLLLLASLTWLTQWTQTLFTLFEHAFSVRDVILLLGGLFLLAKGTSELHFSVNPSALRDKKDKSSRYRTFSMVILQIMVLDIIFSLDSVITAIGIAQDYFVMALAIIITIGLMLWASAPLSRFIHTYPSLKILGLSFLFLVGLVLIAEGFGLHIPRGYLYFAIAFSIFVESLNLLAQHWKKAKKTSSEDK